MRRSKILFLAVAALAVLAPDQARAADVTLVPTNAGWKYLDNGSDQGWAWRNPSFDDSSWASGSAPLGYGDRNEATLINPGPDGGRKFITTYFRRYFNVADASKITGLTLRLLRDDGAVVYLNGREIWRTNMPDGEVTFVTPASACVGFPDELNFFEMTISASFLLTGRNSLAVEIHQCDPSSTDVHFDLQLIGAESTNPGAVVLGPYLQSVTSTSVVVRWRTDVPTDSRVRFGVTQGSLNLTADQAALTADHEVVLSGLSSDTMYHYSVGTMTSVLAGDDSDHYFVTSPIPGTAKPLRIWVLGGSGTADANALAVRNGYLNFSRGTRTDLWLMLGDNAYVNGTESEYRAAVFDMYMMMLRNSVLWPTLGEHDTASPTFPLTYYGIFTLPGLGEAGGLPSGTEDYYSFDFGNVHFICLNSVTSDRSPGGPMLTWLQNDVDSTSQPWVIAYWHHPPYSKGFYDSDADMNMAEMRRNVLPILEAGGVDLVLAAHSHTYERSFLVNGHYGSSGDFLDSMKRSSGNGGWDGDGPYAKATLGRAAHEGTVYAVVGSSGSRYGGPLNHPAMAVSLNSLGSLVLDINDDRLDAAFLTDTGAIADRFTIKKGPAVPTIPAAPANLTAAAISANRIDLSWSDESSNENGFRIERCTGKKCTDFVPVGRAGPNDATFSDTGLSRRTVYEYRVRSFSAAGYSAYSNTVRRKTLKR